MTPSLGEDLEVCTHDTYLLSQAYYATLTLQVIITSIY